MGCARGKMQEVAGHENVRLAIDTEFAAAAQHLDEHIARCAVLGEGLALGKSKKHGAGVGRGEKGTAYNAVSA